MSRRKLSRRHFVVAGAALAATSAATSCGPALPNIPTATPRPTVSAAEAPAATPASLRASPTTMPAAKPATGAASTSSAATTPSVPTKLGESPALATLVKQGKLPPVEQRVPKEPLVITPHESVGMYGGRWRSGLLGKADSPWVGRTMADEPLLRWDESLTKVIPNVAKKWSVSEDGREFTFYLREGMKWSDGSPHTADDFVFWYEDVVLNDALTPVKPLWFKTGGQLGKLEKVDDYTIKMTFPKPNGLLIRNMAIYSQFWVQAKYAKQFHIKYSKDAVEKMVKDQKMQDWVALFKAKTDLLDNPEFPVVFAWHITTPITKTTEVVAQRNPYYWKVDTQGNQLPYIDEMVYPVFEKVDTLVLKALAGEVDMDMRHINNPDNKAVLIDNQAKGAFHLFSVKYAWEGPDIIGLNLNHKDPALRSIFLNKKFRMALSYAMNRKDIIDAIYVGDGQPRQPAPLDESPHFNKQLAYQYTEYDVKQANQLLDGIGLAKRDSNGMRLRPDGKPLFFTVDVIEAFEPWPKIMELVTKYWKAVGVNAAVKTYERSIFYQRKAALEHDAGVWTGADGIQAVMDPRWYMPFSVESIYGIGWANWWLSGGKTGVEPPPEAKKQQDLYEQLQTTVDESKQNELMQQILGIAADQFWAIGITKYYHGFGLVKNNFKNVPNEIWEWHLSSAPGQTNPEQYYIAS